jgi:hypothetical protein
MSAFVVSDKHIWVIVEAYAEFDPNFDRQATADMLLAENITSVNYRYSNHPPEPLHPCVQDASAVLLSRNYLNWADLVNLCECYEYQSCEHPEWEGSDAHAFIGRAKETFRERAFLTHQPIGASKVWSL